MDLDILGLDEASKDALATLGLPSLLLVVVVVVVVSLVLLVVVDKLIKPGLDLIWPTGKGERPGLRAWAIRLISVILGAALVWPLIGGTWGLYLGVICGGCAAAIRKFARVTFEAKTGFKAPSPEPADPT